MLQSRFFVLFSCLAALLILSCNTADRINFKPARGEHIVFIGNTFAERFQYYNYFEPLLYQSFPGLDLTVRNMGWSADEVGLQPRPLNFGSLDEHLARQKAGIIFACFGLNEAFGGPDSVEVFKKNLGDLLQHLTTQKYNAASAPKVILVSAIAHEKLGGYLPDPASHNKNLELYTSVMQQLAEKLHIPFINLYKVTAARMESKPDSLTINGIHLNDKGYQFVSEEMARLLNFKVASWEGSKSQADLKSAIDQKNLHFFYKFRAVNGEYIYGRRKEPWVQPPGSILSYPTEMKELEGIVSCLDTIIWKGVNNSSGMDIAKLNKTVSYSTQSEPKSVIPASTEQFTVRDGYEINLFASELDFPIEKPVKLTFDPRGRMWVSTLPSYPQYYPGAPPNDKIVILEDTNKDGRADKHTVFADSLYLPLGFELGHNGVFVTQAPNLVFLKDTNGDDHADQSEIILHGFGTEDVHHSISAHTWGPDGALYMHMGTFLHTQVETPYGPVRGAYGETYRYEPRTMKLQPYISYPYANPWGNVFMRNGTHLIGDVSTGMNYFAPPLTVATDYPKKHVEMKDFLTQKVRPKTCGMEMVSSRQFPDDVQGDVLFNTFIGFQGIKEHSVREEGSGIVAIEKEPLLQSKDTRFRPVDLQFGPDGALYVVDWFNAIINHGERALRDPGRDHSHGRIWRITYKNKKPLEVADLSRLGIPELLDQLKVYEDRVRYRARIQLSNYTKADVLPEVARWVARLDTHDVLFEQNKLEALWVHQQFDSPNEKLLDDLLKASDHNVRAAATRILFYWNDRIKNAQQRLSVMLRDPSPRVRLEAITSLSHFKNEATVNTLLAATELPVDDYIYYAVKEAFKHLKPVWISMFKNNPGFLANEPVKARFLLNPLSSPDSLKLPGFLGGDPAKDFYVRSPLSEQDYKALSNAPAVTRFLLNSNQGLGKDEHSKTSNDVIYISTLSGKMAFDKTSVTVTAGNTVRFIFQNLDEMLHNFVIINPGSSEKVGQASDAMAALKDGFEKNFVPALPEVLAATPLISSGKTFELVFKAPSITGDYPFHCFFPGHWRVMKGVVRVVDSRSNL